MENDQPQGVEERMAQFLEAEEDAPGLLDEESIPAEAESDADETDAEGETVEAQADEPDEEIVHNGEVKKLTKTELKELAQKGFDYTQKTQELAEQRRYVEQQHAVNQYQAKFQAQFTNELGQVKAIESQLNEWKSVNWQQLATDDPMQYLTAHQQYQEVKEAYQTKINSLTQMQQEALQVQQQQSAQRLALEAQAMKQAIPEWKDQTKATAEMGEVKQYLEKAGFAPEDIAAVADHKQVVIARKAMLYDKMMANGQKKVSAAPPTAKPGSPVKPTQAVDQKLRQELKRSGKGDYAAKLIERML